MKQIIQELKRGDTLLEEVPVPIVRKGCVLIKTHSSLVSIGTEKMLVEFGKSNLINKAIQQPEKVKQVIDKIKTDGLLPTIEAVFNKLDEPIPLGYCNAGKVIAVGEGVTEFAIGDRVASNGPHAEIVCVPKNLVVQIPPNVSYEEASFTVIGAIGLQGIRLANPAIGETAVVIGLGLIGLITAEMLVANGCRVIGFDPDANKVALAIERGVAAFVTTSIDTVKTVEEHTQGIGCDMVIITATSQSNELISQAAQMSRKKGKIVLVGVVGLDLKRADFYKKELSFQVSCSYGPGRYDENYEQGGIDYPLAYVRWTEKRNFETVLHAISRKQLNVAGLITGRFPLTDFMKVYGNMDTGSIASILEYTGDANKSETSVAVTHYTTKPSKGVIGIIGAGNFTKMTILPALKGAGAHFKYIASAGGLSAKLLATKYKFEVSTTDYHQILNDREVDLVMITTRHHLHAKQVIQALQAGKNVFVEKPLAINADELAAVIEAYQSLQNPVSVSVGYNRRYSVFSQKAKQLIGSNESPLNMIATINAGFISQDSWVQDMLVGGGRIIGEACHFVDLMIYLSGSKVKKVVMSALGTQPPLNSDNVIIILQFENGSQGTINYFSNGNKSASKEKIEIYSQNKIVMIDNFRKMTTHGFKSFSSLSSSQDKGHKEQFRQLLQQVKQGGSPMIPFEEIVNSTRAVLAAVESLQKDSWIVIN